MRRTGEPGGWHRRLGDTDRNKYGNLDAHGDRDGDRNSDGNDDRDGYSHSDINKNW